MMEVVMTKIKITPDWTLMTDSKGRVTEAYRRHKTPLDKLRGRDGFSEALCEAGAKYARTWAEAGFEPAMPYSDTTRIIVDSPRRTFEPIGGSEDARKELDRIEREALGATHRMIIEAICGREVSLRTYAFQTRQDRRRVKRELRIGLTELAGWYRRRTS